MFQPSVQTSTILRQRNIVKTSNNCKETLRESCKQYLQNTTLHGLKYCGDSTISVFERIFFGLTFILMVLLSAYFISNVYLKYSASPMIISLSSMSTDITRLPFPAITVCNMNQAVLSVVKKYPKDSEDYSMVQSICSSAIDENVTNSEDGKWSAYQRLLINVSQPCEEMFISCIYGGFEYNCTDIIVTVLTDEGLCCTFNGVNKKFIAKDNIKDPQEFKISERLEYFANNWTPEKGFANEDLKKHKLGYPRPTAGTGTHLGLTVLLDGGISEYYCSSTNSYGFKILPHSPNEAPRITSYGTSIYNGYESRVVITPTLSEASKAIRNMPVSIRQCIFESENNLIYYRTYSRGNCEMECSAKIYLRYCKCILYFMPRFNDDITICGRQNDACVAEVTARMNEHENSSYICKCLPGCFEINYDAEVSMAPLLPEAQILRNKKFNAPNVTVAHIFYKSNFFRSQKKDELIGFTEFLSNTGGLLGLFMGFSVFSMVEIFYFLSIRPYSNYMKLSDRRRKSINRMFRKVRKFRSRRILTPMLTPHLESVTSHSSIHSIYP